MKKINKAKETYEYLNFCINNEIEDTFYCIFDEVCIHTGSDDILTWENKIDMPVYNIDRYGGTFVANIGDIAIVHLTKTQDNFLYYLSNFLNKKLLEKQIKSNRQKNDLIIDKKFKFMGDMNKKVTNNLFFKGAHISFKTNNELIKQVCNKKQDKTPMGLNEWNIQNTEVEKWLQEFYLIFSNGGFTNEI